MFHSLRYSSVVICWVLWLLCLSLIQMSFGSDIFHPMDARTALPVDAASLIFPCWGAVIEPLAAPLHMIGTLPDLRVGMASLLL